MQLLNNIMIIYFAFFVLLLNAKNSDVITATEKTFQNILSSKLPVLVKFYAPWCGHCKSLAPVWEQAATSLKGLVNVVKVDCTVDQSLCGRFDVKGYPTLKLFKNKGKKVQDYQQSRDLAAIVRFATGEIDDKSVKIKSDADLDKFLTKDSTLPHVMLFSDKAAAAPLYKALSSLFEGSIVFGLVSSKAQSVVNKYGPIEKFPHIIVSSADGTTRSYSGEIALEPLKTFLSEFGTSADSQSESKPEAAKPAPKPAKPATPPAEWRDATKENVDEVCKTAQCIVALVDFNSETNAPVDSHKAVLDDTLNNYKKGGKFLFFFGPVGDATLSSKFKSSEPILFLYNVKKQKIAKSSSLEVSSVHNLLDRALGGDITFVPL